MKNYTVKQVAKASGVSVRTLHHYDEIGLLKPARIGDNGYRYYGQAELLRLQQILIHRELGMPLKEIAAALDSDGGDRLALLKRQRERLAAEARRYADLVATIDRTIDTLQGDGPMSATDLYRGFSAEKQRNYEHWLIETFGGDMAERVETSRKAYAKMSDAEKQAAMQELAELENGLAEGLRRDVPPDSESLAPLLDRHRQWVSLMWDKPCPLDAYAGLADLYLSHPDFVARYESIQNGFADYLAAAMKAYAARPAAH